MSSVSVISSVLGGCVGCQAGVEYFQREIKEGIQLITFCTFLLVSMVGLVAHMNFFKKRQYIPTRAYLRIVVIFFVVSMVNNYSLKFQVSMPLFIIFKSGSLIANVIMGRVMRNYMYSWKQIFAVLLTTGGIIVFTMASAHSRPQTASQIPAWTKFVPFAPFWIGVSLMTVALFLSTYLGIYQEDLFRTYGKHSEEAAFFVHFLSIPGFAFVGEQIYTAGVEALNAAPITVLGIQLPVWILLCVICGLQYLCTSNVFRLAAVTSSLNVTMVITLRKFLSLLLSVYLFNNQFTTFHVMGTVFVFLGSFMFF